MLLCFSMLMLKKLLSMELAEQEVTRASTATPLLGRRLRRSCGGADGRE